MSLQLLATVAGESINNSGHPQLQSLEADAAGSPSTYTTTALRKKQRSKRACDKCSSSRTRCNSEIPCTRCREYGYFCSYRRETKKRGRRHKLPADTRAGDGSSAARGAPLAAATPPIFEVNSTTISKSVSTLDQSNISHDHREVPLVLSSQKETASSTWQGYQDQEEGFDSNGNTTQRSLLSYPLRLPSMQLLPIDSTSPLPLRSSSSMTTSQALIANDLRRDSYVGHNYNMAESPLRTPDIFPLDTTATPYSYLPPNTTHSSSHAELSPAVSFASHSMSISKPESLPQPCRYPILETLFPILEDIMPISVACELLQLYFIRPGGSLLKCASPYVLTHVLRRRAVLHPTNPRRTSKALLLAMLLATAHTAEIASFHVPGSRAAICDKLYEAAVEHLCDPDHWHRLLNGVWVNLGNQDRGERSASEGSFTKQRGEVVGPNAGTDELLALILVTIVTSGGTFKSDCLRWWNKALRLARGLKLNQLDSKNDDEIRNQSLPDIEAAEEKRQLFWLLFSLDRHLALSYNAPLAILDADITVYLPLPEAMWDYIDIQPLPLDFKRTYGPKTTISGTDFFDFFLPLMTILGDIVVLHHRRLHPRFCVSSDSTETAIVEKLLEDCQSSLQKLEEDADVDTPGSLGATTGSDFQGGGVPNSSTRMRLVTAYSTHIIHVLAVLLYGKWDPLAMLATEDSDDWMTPARFMKCASHAVSASHAVATIITLDPELVFMPYLFGIYLLHGSFTLLLFADRMPQLGGPNPEVEQACETIIRAHEICVVTLSTEFQRSFRRVLRSTLYNVRSAVPGDLEESQARINALEMYRWARGGRGLAL